MSADSKTTTFEFKIECVRRSSVGVFAFGCITKGAVHEGIELQWNGKNGGKRVVTCYAIAGFQTRLFSAGADYREINVGLLIKPTIDEMEVGDQLFSYDKATEPRILTSRTIDCSIMNGVRES